MALATLEAAFPTAEVGPEDLALSRPRFSDRTESVEMFMGRFCCVGCSLGCSLAVSGAGEP